MDAGYTLDQLLTWCLEDNLIDSYERSDDQIVILQGNLRHEMPAAQAMLFLKRIFRGDPMERAKRRLKRYGPEGQQPNLA